MAGPFECGRLVAGARILEEVSDAGLERGAPLPTRLVVHKQSRVLEVEFDDGRTFRLPFEFLRVHSPSAEVRGHGPGQEVLQVGKREVDIVELEPVGNYAVQPRFSDGHATGIYSWDTLYSLGRDQEALWADYLRRLQAAGASPRPPAGSCAGCAGPDGDDGVGCRWYAPRRRPFAEPAAMNAPADRPAGTAMAGTPTDPGAASGAGTTAAETGTTHFGYRSVAESQKAAKVAEVFHSVAQRYDLMNDMMSGGLHRVWKAFTVSQAALRPGMKVLDVAGGTADLARAMSPRVGAAGEVWLTDINGSMLSIGRDRLLDDGQPRPAVQCDAERLPFPTAYFDRVTVAFGLRNMTHKDRALREMTRVLRPGGRLLVLEFSKVARPLERLYDLYSFSVLPWLGQRIAGDADSYRYLAESIRMHPDQRTLEGMLRDAGLERVRHFNLTGGVVALHEGVKF